MVRSDRGPSCAIDPATVLQIDHATVCQRVPRRLRRGESRVLTCLGEQSYACPAAATEIQEGVYAPIGGGSLAGRVRLGARGNLRGRGRGTRLASATLVAMLAAAFAFSAPATAQDGSGDAPADVSTTPTDTPTGGSDAPDAGASEEETEPAETPGAGTEAPETPPPGSETPPGDTTEPAEGTTPTEGTDPAEPFPRPGSAPRVRPDASLRTSPPATPARRRRRWR